MKVCNVMTAVLAAAVFGAPASAADATEAAKNYPSRPIR